MSTRTKIAPRKKPIQARSRATVDAILEAATYILVEDGWERFTTNRVAERAGVNVASLYQYFPNKEAIVAELQRRHSREIRELLPTVLLELHAQRDLRGALRVIVAAVVEEHRVAPSLHRVFAQELPRSARQREPNDGQRWSDLLEPFMKYVPDRELALFVARCAVHSAIHEAATERPELLESSAFAEEIVIMIERYFDRRGAEVTARPRYTSEQLPGEPVLSPPAPARRLNTRRAGVPTPSGRRSHPHRGPSARGRGIGRQR
jgi:AcrR family transcriptional regulator